MWVQGKATSPYTQNKGSCRLDLLSLIDKGLSLHIPRSNSTVFHLAFNKELSDKMVVDEDIAIISFYMRDARYGRFCGGEVYPKFIPMEYKFQDFGKMSHKIPDYIMKLR